MTFHGLVHHIGLGGRSEHLFYGEVKRTYTVSLLEGKAMVAGRFTDYVHRGTLTFGYLAYMFDGLFLNQQAHAFLAFVGNDFLGRQSRVTDGQLAHVN